MTWCFGGAAMADYEAQVRVAKALRELDDIFVENDIFHRVSQEFGLKLATLLLDIEEGRARRGKASGLVVLGPSGSGKTTAVERCIFSHPMLRPPSTQRRGVERVRQMDVCALKPVFIPRDCAVSLKQKAFCRVRPEQAETTVSICSTPSWLGRS